MEVRFGWTRNPKQVERKQYQNRRPARPKAGGRKYRKGGYSWIKNTKRVQKTLNIVEREWRKYRVIWNLSFCESIQRVDFLMALPILFLFTWVYLKF